MFDMFLKCVWHTCDRFFTYFWGPYVLPICDMFGIFDTYIYIYIYPTGCASDPLLCLLSQLFRKFSHSNFSPYSSTFLRASLTLSRLLSSCATHHRRLPNPVVSVYDCLVLACFMFFQLSRLLAVLLSLWQARSLAYAKQQLRTKLEWIDETTLGQTQHAKYHHWLML